jgi:hypothetical protein
MKHAKKTLIAVSTLALLSLILVSALARRRAAVQQSGPGMGVEIYANSDKTFYIPAPADGGTISAFVRVPHDEKQQASDDRPSAVRLTPEADGDKLKVSVYALYGDLGRVKTCDDYNGFEKKFVASYVAGPGEKVTVSKLNDLGVTFKQGELTFKVVPKRAVEKPGSIQPASYSPVQRQCECGSCGGLSCCPNTGYCLGCGSCGDVCCAR